MEFHLFQSATLLFLGFIISHAAIDPEVYFKSMLPNTPMPKSIKDSLSNDVTTSLVLGKPKTPFTEYDSPVSNEQIRVLQASSRFFLEKNLKEGKTVKLHVSKELSTTPPFVPRQVADSWPITSNNIQDIYEAFKVTPGSIEADLIKKTVNVCEKASNHEEDQYCATSLESMVDFAASKLGKNVKVISTQVNGVENTPLHGYKVEDVMKLNGDTGVVCHQEYYAYAVNYCHKAPKINAYMVSLVGEDNVRTDALSICHQDTSSWNPKHLAFQVLDVKRGTDAVCHFLVEDEVVWVPY
ncbi:BURP domain-containing protein 5-like [Rutidosis leptorrhynchoides]|uniref:BURP domain-containing protein 5-like n=1 Tax=Rutidosis leptorrhynchoides TaxID=125765 RepID=UPI003A99B0A6